MIGQLPSGSGSSIPSHIRCVEALRPAWPSCIASLALLFTCTKSTIRFHAATCSGLYIPVLGAAVHVHEVDDPLPRRDMLRLVHPGAPRRNPPGARHVGH